MKKSQKVLKKRIRENISILLCLSLLLGVIGFPFNVKAAGEPTPRTYRYDGSLPYPFTGGNYLFTGDYITGSSDNIIRIFGKTRVPATDYKQYNTNGNTFTVSEKFEGGWAYGSYIYLVPSSVWGAMDHPNPGQTQWDIYIDAFPGFQIIYHDAAGNALNSWGSHFYFLDYNSDGEVGVNSDMISDFDVERAYDETFGEQIGWSVSPDYLDSTESSGVLFIGAEEGPALLFEDNLFAACMNNTQNAILNLYPVFNLTTTTLSVSAENFKEGQELSLSIDTNRTDDYSLKFEKKNEDGTFTEISAAPTIAGDYRVTVIYPETDSLLVEGDYGMEIEQRGYTAISRSAEFSIISDASLATKPAAKSLTYNGSSQALVSEGTASIGELRYSLSEDGEYTTTVPSAKDAGKYTVWYMVKSSDGKADIPPAGIDVTIAPKTVGLTWSNTSFTYDGEKHCPTASLTGVLTGDTCSVTVTGEQSEEGTYTATASALSNSNYALPGENTKEFKINGKDEATEETDPNKLKGTVSVSMSGFYYGGTATSPVISSSTNDVKNAKVTYKAAGSADSAYSPSVPTEAGNYVVKVTLPANDNYNACSATAEFTINYLPVPQNAYFIRGTQGKSDWYTSEVLISPGQGYQISFGDRNHFTTNPIKIERNVNQVYVYIRDAGTYEQTDVITIGGFKIDTKAPVVEDMESGKVYFADESGNVTCVVSDDNLSYVVIGETKVTLTDLGNGRKSFTVPAGAKKETVSFTAYDLAGNKTDFSLTTAPSWKRDGVISEGEIYLEAGEKFTIPEGEWTVDGDDTVYYGGTIFYASKEGMYTFKKQ
ncbi:MAG: hypothetical protein J6X97_09530 [Lachnospiraceae bacterium]|nr:hypothetical protein [Lachnospiraceae bacterium]